MEEIHLLFYFFIVIGVLFFGINLSKIITHNQNLNKLTSEKIELLNSKCINCGNNSIKAFQRRYSTSAIQSSDNGIKYSSTPKSGIQYLIMCKSCDKKFIEWHEEIPSNNLKLDIKGSSQQYEQLSSGYFSPILRKYIKNSDCSGVGFTGCLGLLFWTFELSGSLIFIFLIS